VEDGTIIAHSKHISPGTPPRIIEKPPCSPSAHQPQQVFLSYLLFALCSPQGS
jgi:hypothetical protein